MKKAMADSRYKIPDAPKDARVEFWLDILLVNVNYLIRNIVDPSHNKKHLEYLTHTVKQKENKNFRYDYDMKYVNVFTEQDFTSLLGTSGLPLDLPMLIPDAPVTGKIHEPVQFKINKESYTDTCISANTSYITVKGYAYIFYLNLTSFLTFFKKIEKMVQEILSGV